MKILFNQNNKGADELRELTGSYYANNDFRKIRMDIILESEKIIDLVGDLVYTRAADHYTGDRYLAADPTPNESLNDYLVQHLQLPIALMASYKFYQSNLVSHEDSGRKIKINDANEKLAWEWMLDRDDEAHTRKAFATMDRLIRFLDKKDIPEWKDSPQKLISRALFINSTEAFNDVYPIENSPRFFYSTLAFNREVQRDVIQKILGAKYADLLNYYQNPPSDADDHLEILLSLVKNAIPLQVMVLALKRFPVQVLPEGVVQHFRSISQSRTASQPASAEILRIFTSDLEKDAAAALDKIKRELKSLDPEASKYSYLPKNDPCNIYFRT